MYISSRYRKKTTLFLNFEPVKALVRLFIISLFIGSLLPMKAPAQESNEEFQRISVVPVIGYTEETQYQFGAMAILFFKPSFEGGAISELDLSCYGTSRKQLTGSISPKFFFLKDRISTDIDLHYENWVGNFFGAGNNPDYDDFRKFDRETFYIQALVEANFGTKQWLPAFKYGPYIEKPQDTDGWRNGIGYHFSLDTRDNTNWARHGYLVQWGHYFYNKALGDYSYTQQELDIRGY